LTSIPYDVFIGGGRPEDGTPIFFEMGSTGIPPIRVAGGARPVRNVHAFAMYSHGPNVIDDFDGEQNWPFHGPANPCPDGLSTISYSPTNGSRSRGNIHKFGGSWTAGHWCLDNVVIRGAHWDALPGPF